MNPDRPDTGSGSISYNEIINWQRKGQDMKGGLGAMMKQAQQMQEKMQKAQEDVANLEVEGQSGGGLVKVLMTGRHELRKVSIDDTLMGEDKEMLEDLIAASVNDATAKLESKTRELMAGATDGLQLPAGMKLPF